MAAGAGFCQSQSLAFGAESSADDALERILAFTVDGLAQNFLQLSDIRGEIGLAAELGQAQAHADGGIGQVSQVDIGREGIFPGFDLLGQRGFRNPEGDNRMVGDFLELEMPADVGHYGGKQADGFKRHAREGIQGRFALLSEAVEGHARGCTQSVGDYGAVVRNQGLGAVGVDHRDAACTQNPLDMSHLLAGFLIALRSGKLPEGILCDIVFRRSQTAGYDDDVGIVEAAGQFADNPAAVVSDRGHILDLDAEQVEFTGDMGRVRIDDLADENLIADGAYRSCFHLFSKYLTSL